MGNFINDIAPGLDPNNLLQNIENAAKIKSLLASGVTTPAPRGTTPKRETSKPPATTRGRTPSSLTTPKKTASRVKSSQARPARRPSNAGQRT